MENDEMVCYCSIVTKGQIIEALADVRQKTGACTLGQCKELSPRGVCCSPIIMDIIKAYQGQ